MMPIKGRKYLYRTGKKDQFEFICTRVQFPDNHEGILTSAWQGSWDLGHEFHFSDKDMRSMVLLSSLPEIPE